MSGENSRFAALRKNRRSAEGSPVSPRALIFSVDDFGLSSGVNRAVVQAHQQGLLTNASLMVNGAAFEEAVELARDCPQLGVGLHLVLLQGRAALPQREIPGLVDGEGYFSDGPVTTGIRYFFARALHPQLEREVRAQLEKFLATGLPLSHVDGHLNIHMHPTVLAVLLRLAPQYGIRALRLPSEPLWVSLHADHSAWPRKVLEAIVFRALCRYARRRLDLQGLVYPDHLFGLHHSGHITEPYLLAVLEQLPQGVTEIYTHAAYLDDEARRWRPADYEPEHELAALLSPRVAQRIRELGIVVTNYRELAALWSAARQP